MKKLITLLLILVCTCSFAQMRGGAQYDPGAARKNLSNVDASATPSMTSITLSGKVRAAWADILGDIYASGTVKVSAGTAAAPAYSFSTDPDTGIYSPGANVLGFGVNGVENARISVGGNVLIATSTDDGSNKLQVNGFTKLGNAATGIKMKVLTGTTGVAGGNTVVNHGIPSGKILGYNAIVFTDSETTWPPNTTGIANLNYYLYSDLTKFTVFTASDGTTVAEKPFKIMVWYVE